jgi:hypothetical protein
LAVFRLMTSSTLVACCTGRSPASSIMLGAAPPWRRCRAPSQKVS